MKTCSRLAAYFHRGEGGVWWAVLGQEWAAFQVGEQGRVNPGWATGSLNLGPDSGAQPSYAG